MFTRIIDPFNNQKWKFPNKTQQTSLYKANGQNVEQRKMKKSSCRQNKSLDPDGSEDIEIWTVKEETRSQSAPVEEEANSDCEEDDFVLV
jgi:hypothetical protein